MTAPVFADSSAGVKRYLDEPGAEIVRGATELVFSALTRVELPSAVWRKEREGLLTVDQVAAVLDAFEGDWHGTALTAPVFGVIATDPNILVRAAQLTGRHALRAGDAIQLACAVEARRATSDLQTFLAFDERLRAAALREGFAVLPAEI